MTVKVLIVDDEDEFLVAMAERMRARDMEVHTTTSAAEALKLIEKARGDAEGELNKALDKARAGEGTPIDGEGGQSFRVPIVGERVEEVVPRVVIRL